MTKAATPATPVAAATTAKKPVTRARKKPEAKVDEPKAVSSLLNQPLTKGSPYTLESANLIMEMGRLKENAESEIVAIQAEQKSIHDQAQRDMEVIANRAKTEIDARNMRISDLQRSILLVSLGLDNDLGEVIPPETVVERTDPPPSEDENEQ